MRPRPWQPPVALSDPEQAIVARIRRARLFVVLRAQRHELFDAAFQDELAAAYQERDRGQPPVPPAQVALALILQAYTGVSDDEVIAATVMDRRWQLSLDCLDAAVPPFSKGTLVGFRQRPIGAGLDRRLVERTVELARARGGFGPRQLRAALDSSPLWGAGRVEDPDNLPGHALRKALGVIARQQGRGRADLAAEAGAELVAGSSLKAALDLDWDDPAARERALRLVLGALDAVEQWLATAPAGHDAPRVADGVAAAREVRTQDVTTTAGAPTLRQGVASERRIGIEDAEMRHGRKSRSRPVNGDKRHVLHDLDSGLVPADGLTPANAHGASVTDDIAADLAAQRLTLREVAIDRAYLPGRLVHKRPTDLVIACRAWPDQAGPHIAKSACTLDWDRGTIRCPNGAILPFTPGGTVQFPAAVCAACPLQARCTSSRHGRTVSTHPDERLLQELRERQQTAAGRAALRERVAVEHTLAHVGRWQGDRARYCGQRKNLFDLRRIAVVHNLHVLQRREPDDLQAA